MQGVYVLLLAIAAFVGAFEPSIGKCRIKPDPACNLNFTQLALENNGTWSYMVTHVEEITKNLMRMQLLLAPTSTEGRWSFTVYVENKGEKRMKTIDTFLQDEGHGMLTIYATHGNTKVTFIITIMRYDPGEFVFYYICCDYGEDDTTDYRFALSHKPLTREQEFYIDSVQMRYQFRGTLRKLPNY